MAAVRSKQAPLKNMSVPLFVDFRPVARKWTMKASRRTAEAGRLFESKRTAATHRLATCEARNSEPFSTYALIELRDDFFRADDAEKTLLFLNTVGTFELVTSMFMDEFQEWRRYFTELSVVAKGFLPDMPSFIYAELEKAAEEPLFTTRRARFLDPPTWSIEEDDKSATGFSARCSCENAVEVINALIRVERMAGGEFLQCKNCKYFFAKDDSRRSDFCSHRCGHRHTQRTRRQAQRIAKKKGCEGQ